MPLIRDNKTLAVLIAEYKNAKINDLPTDMQVLFGLLKLIVDIRYRVKHDSTIENNRDGE